MLNSKANHSLLSTGALLAMTTVMLLTGFLLSGIAGRAETVGSNTVAGPFRIGEKLTYNLGFGRFGNAGYAEVHVASRGKLEKREAVELRMKVRTADVVSAAFYMVDESRTTFIAPETGLPLYVRRVNGESGLPRESNNNYLVAPSAAPDLLTLVYRLREAGGSGSFSLQENDRLYGVTAQTSVSEKVKSDAGDFDTIVSLIQSDYFTEIGIREVKVNFSTDESRIPVLIRVKVAKGEFRALLASIQNTEPEPVVKPTVAPTAPPTPKPALTPKPSPTPTPYTENEPLATDLPFALGETVTFNIIQGGQPAGKLTIAAPERKKADGKDSLLLTATVDSVTRENVAFKAGDSFRVQADPETLAPHRIDVSFNGTLAALNQTVLFDQMNGLATPEGGTAIAVPVGTHSLLSFIYAIRSFNLKPSKVLGNPINDTRVAVFYIDRAYVFTVRPSEAEVLTINGEKVPAQLVTILTGNQELDQMSPKIWLSTDSRRLPVRITFGEFALELADISIIRRP